MKQNYTLPTEAEVNAVKLNWRRYLLPAIHPEGIKILLVEAIIVIILSLLMRWIGVPGFWLVGVAILVFSYYFFRNPVRVSPQRPNLIIAPADGIVSNIKEIVPPKELDLGEEPMIRISTFMSVFNVHVNRSPVSGVVHRLNYRPGKFVNVADKDSEDNERQEISLIADNGLKVGCVQIAGLVARRIYCPLKVGDKLEAGQVFGMIRFGSRLDVYLPKGVYPCVRVGQSMVAGETILADMEQVDVNEN